METLNSPVIKQYFKMKEIELKTSMGTCSSQGVKCTKHSGTCVIKSIRQ
jgi:hypothetical protein